MNQVAPSPAGLPALYGASYSVYVRIARMALHEKGVAYRHEPIDIFDPGSIPADYATLHLFMRIPALRHGALTLYETQAITRYVDEAFEGPAMQPTEAADRARMNQIMGIVDSYAYRTLVWDIYVERIGKAERGEEADEACIVTALPRARTCLAALSALLGSQEYFAPGGICLADLHLAPVFGYFTRTPEAATLLADFPSLRDWWSKMQLRESWQACQNDTVS